MFSGTYLGRSFNSYRFSTSTNVPNFLFCQSFCFGLKPTNVTFLLYKTHWLIAWPTKLLYWPRISFNLLERGICNSTTRKITQFSRRLPSRVLSRFFDQVGRETSYASIGNNHFFTKYCHCQTSKVMKRDYRNWAYF